MLSHAYWQVRETYLEIGIQTGLTVIGGVGEGPIRELVVFRQTWLRQSEYISLQAGPLRVHQFQVRAGFVQGQAPKRQKAQQLVSGWPCGGIVWVLR